MRFTLLDRIVELEPGARIVAIKNLTLAEEYLADHFPKFPVMPGVMMLEAMVQASAWLVRQTDEFAHSMVLLKEAKNVKYGNFVKPGQTLTIAGEIKQHGNRETKLEAQGTVDGVQTVSAKLVLERYNLADENPARARTDRLVIDKLRDLFALLRPVPLALR